MKGRAVRRVAVLVALVAAAAHVARGQSGPPPPSTPEQTPPTPTFARDVELGRVDVVVTDKSARPVTGLTKDDFILSDECRCGTT